MKNRYDIFISYSASDKLNVKELAETLVVNGLSVWLDDWNLTVGERWQEAISNAINNSNCILLYLGKDGLSKWTLSEINEAIKVRKNRIISILDKNVNIDALPIFLKDTVILKVDDENFLEKLITAIKPTIKIDEINSIVKELVAERKYSEALQTSKEAIQIIEKHNLLDNVVSTTYNNIGLIYRNLGNYETALKNLEQSLQISQEIGDKSGEAYTLFNLAMTYLDPTVNQAEKGMDYLMQVAVINKTLQNAEIVNSLKNAFKQLGIK